MPQFDYKIVDPNGKIVRGSLEAANQERVKSIVQSDGSYIVEIKEASILNKEIDFTRVTEKDLGMLCSQISSILKAGVPVDEAIRMSESAIKNTKLKKTLKAINERVVTGIALSAAMKEYQDVYPNIMVQMIKAGEESGNLDNVFARLELQFKKQAELKNQIKKATSYPKMILIVIALALVVVCGYVVPMFAEILNGMGSEIPWSTKMFMGLSDLITKKWWILLISIIVFFVGFKIFKNSNVGKRSLDKAKIIFPLLKDLNIKTNSADFARTLSTLLSSGMDYTGALNISKDTVRNVYYKEAVEQIYHDVVNGMSFADALIRTHMFPDMLETLVKIGESTGNVPKMLNNAADYFEDEVQTATMQLTAALNPLILVFMGVFVGLLVYSIYSPMFGMYSGIAG